MGKGRDRRRNAKAKKTAQREPRHYLTEWEERQEKFRDSLQPLRAKAGDSWAPDYQR